MTGITNSRFDCNSKYVNFDETKKLYYYANSGTKLANIDVINKAAFCSMREAENNICLCKVDFNFETGHTYQISVSCSVPSIFRGYWTDENVTSPVQNYENKTYAGDSTTFEHTITNSQNVLVIGAFVGNYNKYYGAVVYNVSIKDVTE